GLTCLTSSCELLDECGTCEMVTIDANDNETRSTPLPFCGEELQNKKDSPSETIGGVTTYWECY
ncbi:MAG: hypothetical protein QNK35_06590, partial [Bacteroides sp.]|nr:hypothetical protein [Bacteroides sp.]